MIKLSALKLNERNPRSISEDSFNRLCASIQRDPQFMELRPIVVDEQLIILGGNQRYRACLHLGMKEVPDAWVKEATGLTDEQRRRFVLIDNAPEGMSGEWDFDVLSADFDLPELKELGFDELMTELDSPIETEEGGRVTSAHSITVHFSEMRHVKSFAKAIRRRVTEDVKVIWWPRAESNRQLM